MNDIIELRDSLFIKSVWKDELSSKHFSKWTELECLINKESQILSYGLDVFNLR